MDYSYYNSNIEILFKIFYKVGDLIILIFPVNGKQFLVFHKYFSHFLDGLLK